ncbi:hypothetical protein AURDEDRAFT_160931 [Auricularia subglabra TFB-10046 SS5]|nr:hypothetical protein AURDEDRAFT_160931 [Auricularia subglabra TFB-10046 SS5]
MVKTRTGRRSYASDEDKHVPGSLPGGPTPVHNRVRELRDTISHLAASPRLPVDRMFNMLQADSPARRESWEGLLPSFKPIEDVFEGHGILEHAAQLPSVETPVSTRSAPMSPLTPLSQMGSVQVGRVARDFEFPIAADMSADSIAEAFFRTADPESAPPTPAAPRAPPTPPPSASTEAAPAPVLDGTGSKKDGGEQPAVITPAVPEPVPVVPVPTIPVATASPTNPSAAPAVPATLPIIKFSAPTSGAGSELVWHEVTEGAVVDAGGWITAVKRSPAKTAQEAVKVPAISGPQSFPPWYLHFNSGDNSGVPDGKESDKEEGPSSRPSNRPSSRASSSMPSLVSETATSSAGPFRSEPVSAPPSSRVTPEPQLLQAGEEPSTVSSYVRKLQQFSEHALEIYNDHGLDAALAFMSSVFPDHHVTLLSVWLDYINRSANSATRMSPNVLIGFSQGRAPPMYTDPEPEPVPPRRKTYSEAARTSPTPSPRPTPDPIGTGRPGKGKGVDPRERPTATSMPKSVRFSFSDASTPPSYHAESTPVTPGILRRRPAMVFDNNKPPEAAASQPSSRTAPEEKPYNFSNPTPGQGIPVWGKSTVRIIPVPLSKNAPQKSDPAKARDPPVDPIQSTPRARAAPPGGYYSESGGLPGALGGGASVRHTFFAGDSSDSGDVTYPVSGNVRNKVRKLTSTYSATKVADLLQKARTSAAGQAKADPSPSESASRRDDAPHGERDARRGPSGPQKPPAGPPGGSGGPPHDPNPPDPDPAGNGHGGSGGGGPGGNGGGGGGSGGGGPPGGGPPGSGPPSGGRDGRGGDGNGPPQPPPPPPGAPAPPGGGDPDDSGVDGLADSDSETGDDDSDDLRARRKLVSQMKIKHPRVYDGRADVDAFDHWCYEVDLWKTMNGVHTRWAIALLSGFLSDKALHWYMNNIVMSKEKWTMRKIYDELFDYCFPSDFKLMLRKRFAQLTQGQRDVREFARDIQVLSRRFPDIGERQLIQVLWEGVHAYIRSKWFDYGFNIDENSFEQLVSAAEQFEKGERARTGADKHAFTLSRVHGRANSERSANWRDRGQNPVSANGNGSPRTKNWVRSNAVGFQSGRGRGGSRGMGNRGGTRGNANATPLRRHNSTAPRREELSAEEKARLQAEGRCFICKSEGHFSRNCPMRMQTRRPAALHSNAARVSKPVKKSGEKMRAHGMTLQDDVPYDQRSYSDDNALQLSGMRLLIDHPENEHELAYAKPYVVQEVLIGKFKNYFGDLTSMDGTVKMHVDRRFTVEYHDHDNSFLVNDWGTGDAYEVFRDDFLSGDMRVSAIVRRHVERHVHGDGKPTIASLRDLSIPNEQNPDYAPDQAVVFVNGEFRLLSNEQAHNLGLTDRRYVILRSRGRTYVRDLETGLDYHVTPEIVAAGISIPAVLDHAESAVTVEPAITVGSSRPVGPEVGSRKKRSEPSEPLERTAMRVRRSARLVPRPVVVEALVQGRLTRVLIDSGSLADFMSTTLADQLKLPMNALERPIPVQLAVKGSRSKINVEVSARFQYQDIDCEKRFDIANLDNYDLILGTPFLWQHSVAIGLNPTRVLIGNAKPLTIHGSEVFSLSASAAIVEEERLEELRKQPKHECEDLCKDAWLTELPPL